MVCRICGDTVDPVLDLGAMPPANILKTSRDERERCFPLVLEKCRGCFNLQLRDCLDEADLYRHYLYLTPNSPSLRSHYARLADHMFGEGYAHEGSFVLEFGSNVGLFLRHLEPRVGRVLGVDPAQNVCAIARERGIETECAFFNRQTAQDLAARHGRPGVVIARHCCAHNKDPHGIIAGVADILPDDGIFIMENAYVLKTLLSNQFDQIYHEHMFYYSIRSVETLFAMHGLRLVDILMAPIHGGSVVFFARRADAKASALRPRNRVQRYRGEEAQALNDALVSVFVENTHKIKADLKALIADLVGRDNQIWAYGATAKGSTLLNFVGITDRQVPFCVDSTPLKQGRYIPMANIEICAEDEAWRGGPDYFLLTAWNYKDEIMEKVRSKGNTRSRFIVPIPAVDIV